MSNKAWRQIWIGVSIAVLSPIVLATLYGFYMYVKKPSINEKRIKVMSEEVTNIKSSVQSVYDEVENKPNRREVIYIVDSLLIKHLK